MGSFVSIKPTIHFIHRDKTRVQMIAKMFAVHGPHSWFLHKAKKQFFLLKFVVFYNKNNIFTILFIVKYEKITLNDEFLVLLGPIISRFWHVQMRKKLNQNNKWCVL
jgi:hypothetical protein